jgi:ubiquitin C
MEGYSFINLKEIINPELKIKDLKIKIKELTGIKEENQRFNILFDFWIQSHDDDNFWNSLSLDVYDITKFNCLISRKLFLDNINLNLNDNIQRLKQRIYAVKNIPIDRQKFYLNDKEIYNEQILKEDNLFKNKLSIELSKLKNDIIYLKYPNSEIKEIKTDLYNTGFELLEEIQNQSIKSSFDIKYNLLYKNKRLILHDLLINNGIKNGATIELINRKSYKIFIKTLTGKTFTEYVEENDKIILLKDFIQLESGIPRCLQRIIFETKQTEDNKIISQYNIKKESTIHLILKLRGNNI